jgi:hypothetical protein
MTVAGKAQPSHSSSIALASDQIRRGEGHDGHDQATAFNVLFEWNRPASRS